MRLTNKDKIKELSTLANNEVLMTDSEHKELKLGQLENIEQELCIDLITLFEALKNGFYAYKDNHIVEIKSQKGNCGAMAFYISCDCIIAEDVFGQQYIYLLKDYGKTWALTKEELLCD